MARSPSMVVMDMLCSEVIIRRVYLHGDGEAIEWSFLL